jgi:hypothetical protein
MAPPPTFKKESYAETEKRINLACEAAWHPGLITSLCLDLPVLHEPRFHAVPRFFVPASPIIMFSQQ